MTPHPPSGVYPERSRRVGHPLSKGEDVDLKFGFEALSHLRERGNREAVAEGRVRGTDRNFQGGSRSVVVRQARSLSVGHFLVPAAWSLPGKNRQHKRGRVGGVVIDGVSRFHPMAAKLRAFAGVQVAIKAREIAAADFQPQPVTG